MNKEKLFTSGVHEGLINNKEKASKFNRTCGIEHLTFLIIFNFIKLECMKEYIILMRSGLDKGLTRLLFVCVASGSNPMRSLNRIVWSTL